MQSASNSIPGSSLPRRTTLFTNSARRKDMRCRRWICTSNTFSESKARRTVRRRDRLALSISSSTTIATTLVLESPNTIATTRKRPDQMILTPNPSKHQTAKRAKPTWLQRERGPEPHDQTAYRRKWREKLYEKYGRRPARGSAEDTALHDGLTKLRLPKRRRRKAW